MLVVARLNGRFVSEVQKHWNYNSYPDQCDDNPRVSCSHNPWVSQRESHLDETVDCNECQGHHRRSEAYSDSHSDQDAERLGFIGVVMCKYCHVDVADYKKSPHAEIRSCQAEHTYTRPWL